MKKGNETITKEERRRRFDEAMTSIQTKFIVEAEEAAPETVKTHRDAPAWLRPVAACLAVLLLGGLVVFSIPVVNNIISRRAPAELPGTDVAEADTKEEETEKKEETEEVEVSLLDKEFAVYLYPDYNGKLKVCYNPAGEKKTASFNDVYHDEHRVYVASLADAEKLEVGMPYYQVLEILGADNYGGKNTYADWALDDGRMLHVVFQSCSFADRWRIMGIWDEEANDFIEPIRNDEPEGIELFNKKNEEYIENRLVVEINIVEDSIHWDVIVKNAVENQANYYYSQGLTPSWDK